jgi:carbamoyltransferase
MIILGINAYHGDVAAALLRDGELIAAVEEERFRRIKHWAGFPQEAIRACLDLAGAAPTDIGYFAISRDPRAHLWRKVLFALRTRPTAGFVANRLRNRHRVGDVAARVAETLGLGLQRVKHRLHWIEHHPAHLASAFYVSRFDDAAVCAIDAFGDLVSTSCAVGCGTKLGVDRRIYFPHSLGLLYLAITQYLGFPRYGDEYKVMGLAPYGEPAFVPQLRQLVKLGADGGFEIDLRSFRHHTEGDRMTWDDGEPTVGTVFAPRLEALLGPARRPDEPIE